MNIHESPAMSVLKPRLIKTTCFGVPIRSLQQALFGDLHSRTSISIESPMRPSDSGPPPQPPRTFSSKFTDSMLFRKPRMAVGSVMVGSALLGHPVFSPQAPRKEGRSESTQEFLRKSTFAHFGCLETFSLYLQRKLEDLAKRKTDRKTQFVNKTWAKGVEP